VDRWHVGFCDLSAGQGLLGQVEDRNARVVIDWLTERDQAWRDAVRFVAIDMCTIFKSAIGQALPQATLVVDHFHLVQLANQPSPRSVATSLYRPAAGAAAKATDPRRTSSIPSTHTGSGWAGSTIWAWSVERRRDNGPGHILIPSRLDHRTALNGHRRPGHGP
jgi:hypothetical protein